MSNKATERLLKGMAATGFGQVVSVLVTFGAYFGLIRLLGKPGFEDWALLGTIPSTLALNDLGFGMAATAEMTQRVARDDRAGALRVFQSCWLLVTLVSFIVFLAALPFALWGPWLGWVKLAHLNEAGARLSAACLVSVMLAQQQLSLIAAAYKSDGLYARVTMIENWQRLLQYIVGLAWCWLSPNLTSFVLGFSITYVAFVLLMAIDLKRQRPWLGWGIKEASWQEVRPLIRPALSFAAYPLGIAMNLQGMIWVINLTLGPVQGYWLAIRALSRAVIQASQIVIGPAPVEISAALGKDDYSLAKRIHHAVLQAGLLVSAASVLLLLLIGPWFFSLYTKGHYELGAGLFAILLAVAFLNAAWNVSMSVAYAVNRHMSLTLGYLAVNAAAIGLGTLIVKGTGFEGLALLLLAVDAFMVVIVLSKALQILQEPWSGCLKALTQNPLHILKRLRAEPKA